MGVPSAQELESLKYSELQKLAKTVGLKANFKAEKLLNSLRQHFCYEPKVENIGQDAESSQSSFSLTDEDDLNSSEEKDVIPEFYVTKRHRGRGKKADKISNGPKVEPNANTLFQPLEEQHEVLSEDKSACPAKDISKRNRKRSRPEDLDEQTAAADKPNETVTPGGKNPRYVGHLKSANSGGRTATPNFKKLHEAHFKKMESIDTFVERNRKRLQALSNSNASAQASRCANNEKDAKNTKCGLTEKPMLNDNRKEDELAVNHTGIKCIENNHVDDNSVKGATPGALVPRYARRQSKAGTRITATTPNLKKLKESHYEKMSLLDEYLERKKARLNAIHNSIEEVKMLSEKKVILKQTSKDISASNSKINNGVWLFSPVPTKGRRSFARTPGSQRRSPRASVNKANLSSGNGVVFKPSILSSSKMNVRFSEATKDNEHKRSLTKTPARRSPYVEIDLDTPSDNLLKDNPLRKSLGKPGTCTSEKSKMADCTPFKFQAENVETPGTNKKMFDIKASLAKPLTYEPHKGKLKPWGDNENPASTTKPAKPTLSTLKKEYKQPHLQTRETRRNKHLKDRKIKKDEMIGTRRGLILK